jgi:serine/threonine protein kinase
MYHAQLCHLQYMHSCNFLHHDLKPNNIAMGVGQKAGIVYLIDFGILKQFRNPNTHMHIPHINMHGLTEMIVFASIHSHMGWELGRWDNLELLAHILIYFFCGSLLWQSLDHQGIKEDFVPIFKQQINVHDLCDNLPVKFHKFLEYMCSLSFDKKPDYHYLCLTFLMVSCHKRDSQKTCYLIGVSMVGTQAVRLDTVHVMHTTTLAYVKLGK